MLCGFGWIHDRTSQVMMGWETPLMLAHAAAMQPAGCGEARACSPLPPATLLHTVLQYAVLFLSNNTSPAAFVCVCVCSEGTVVYVSYTNRRPGARGAGSEGWGAGSEGRGAGSEGRGARGGAGRSNKLSCATRGPWRPCVVQLSLVVRLSRCWDGPIAKTLYSWATVRRVSHRCAWSSLGR